MEKAPGAYWTDEEIKNAIEEWKKKRQEKLKTGDWRMKLKRKLLSIER